MAKVKKICSEHVQIFNTVSYRPILFNVHNSRLRTVTHAVPVGNA
jgi:hypothetical protein